MEKSKRIRHLFILLPLFLLSEEITAQLVNNPWPQRVLLTNDNGIDDPKLKALARAFSTITETYIVAPSKDQSGTTHFMSVWQTGELTSRQVFMDEHITAYSVDGYPADCVFLALHGLLAHKVPDLVLSGINDGPNLGQSWLGSGTVGAARIASSYGVPAIAVSGLDEGIEGSLSAVVEWILRFCESKLVRELKPPQYLTISIPRIKPSDIKGVKLSERSGPSVKYRFEKQKNHQQDVWKLGVEHRTESFPQNTDTFLHAKGYIVVVPMQAQEIEQSMLSRWKNRIHEIPKWTGGDDE